MDKKQTTMRRKSIHDKYVHIKKDLPNIIFLIFLYFLQAVDINFLIHFLNFVSKTLYIIIGPARSYWKFALYFECS